jgi:hypothetical protein
MEHAVVCQHSPWGMRCVSSLLSWWLLADPTATHGMSAAGSMPRPPSHHIATLFDPPVHRAVSTCTVMSPCAHVPSPAGRSAGASAAGVGVFARYASGCMCLCVLVGEGVGTDSMLLSAPVLPSCTPPPCPASRWLPPPRLASLWSSTRQRCVGWLLDSLSSA